VNERQADKGPSAGKPWGVVVVDPLPVVREGIARLIEDQPGLAVLAQASDGQDALLALGGVRKTRVVVLVSLALEEPTDAHWLIREVRDRYPSYAVLAVGANADPTAISRVLFVGADGFVDKTADPAAFVEAIQRAAARESMLTGSPIETVALVADGIERRRDISAVLTRREREVLTVAAEGLTAREMAEQLGVSERTVTTHLGRIYGKLGVGNRLAAVRLAVRSGLVSAGPLD
jgi:two-component system nitrate/nitrite response regulator NarL